MGYKCEIIDYRNKAVDEREFVKPLLQCRSLREIKYYIEIGRFRRKKAKAFNDFIKNKMAISSEVYDAEKVDEMNGKYDCYLVGSDLVWDFTINGHDLNYMFTEVSDSSKKVAFASSVGQVWEKSDYLTVSDALSKFDNIGVRERAIQNLLSNEFNIHSDFVCDPTMLLSAEEWKLMATQKLIQGEYVLIYMADAEKKIYKDAIEYGLKNNIPIYAISFYKVPEGIKAIHPYTVKDFLSLIMYANTVFTASYHGMLFSLYFNKEFFFYNRGWKERMLSISEYLNLDSRERWNAEKQYKPLDYDRINERIQTFREKSEALLTKYLQ